MPHSRNQLEGVNRKESKPASALLFGSRHYINVRVADLTLTLG